MKRLRGRLACHLAQPCSCGASRRRFRPHRSRLRLSLLRQCGSVSNHAFGSGSACRFSCSRPFPASVTLELKRLDPRSTQLVLDTKDLMILDVTQKATDVLGATAKNQTIWVSRPFHLEKPDPILGSALVIDLPPSKKGTESIKIDYETIGILSGAAMADRETNCSAQAVSLHRIRAYQRAQLDPSAGHAADPRALQGQDPYRGSAARGHERGE